MLLPNVTSSAYSISPPMGIPLEIVVILILNFESFLEM